MLCAYCGGFSTTSLAKSPTDSFELRSSNITFQKCSHDDKLSELKSQNSPQYIQTIHDMVSQQIKNLQEIEEILGKLKLMMANRIKSFCESNYQILSQCDSFASNFFVNFSRLKEIKIEPCFLGSINPNVQEYFDKEKLVVWAERCLKESQKVQKKVLALEKEFYPELEIQLKQELERYIPLTQTINSHYQLHKILFDSMFAGRSTGSETTPDHQHLKTIEEIFLTLNTEAKTLIQEKTEKINTILKKANTKLNQGIFLISENVKEIKDQAKVLSIFENMDTLVQKCLEELKFRSKFQYLYKKFLNILNKFSKKENKRRVEFINEYSAKIPSQIFPNIHELARQINIESLFKDVSREDIIQISVNEKEEAKMREVEEIIYSF